MTQRALARALKLSPARVSVMVADGMPTESAESAQAWRVAHSKEGMGHKSDSVAVADVTRQMVEGLTPPRLDETTPDDPAGALARMRETEQRVYALIDAALERAKQTNSPLDYAALPGLIRSYNQAATNALAAAAAWEKHCQASGEVAPVEHLRNVLTAVLEPLMAQLGNLPALIAPKANPANPATAESVIEAEIASIRQQIAAAIVAPIPPPPKL